MSSIVGSRVLAVNDTRSCFRHRLPDLVERLHRKRFAAEDEPAHPVPAQRRQDRLHARAPTPEIGSPKDERVAWSRTLGNGGEFNVIDGDLLEVERSPARNTPDVFPNQFGFVVFDVQLFLSDQ